MNSVGHFVLLVVGLAAGGVTACDHGSCVLSGTPTCSSMNEAGCNLTPPCRWEQACVVRTSCYSASQATCEALDYCEFNTHYCEPTAEPCEPLSVTSCEADERCGLSLACRGTLGPCESHDDEDSCEADLHCDWYRTPAL